MENSDQTPEYDFSPFANLVFEHYKLFATSHTHWPYRSPELEKNRESLQKSWDEIVSSYCRALISIPNKEAANKELSLIFRRTYNKIKNEIGSFESGYSDEAFAGLEREALFFMLENYEIVPKNEESPVPGLIRENKRKISRTGEA